MSLRGVILGTVLQIMLAYFFFMLVVFSAAGIANAGGLSKFQAGVLDFSIYALPATCLVSAGIVLCFYKSGAGPSSYWWYAAPLAALVLYFVYAVNLNGGA
ncbi:MAG: hypothetical protein ACTHJ1_01755 [Bordetella sp.]|uniref:hypothetical protein n=1 Tax=Bordetella sp. TaxID=28081 RepID=UPI003F7BA119